MKMITMRMTEDLAEFLVKDCTSNIELATVVSQSVGDSRQQKTLLASVEKYQQLRDIALGALERSG